MKQRMMDISKEKQKLLVSDLGKLKLTEDRGGDPVGELVSTLEAKIADANKQLVTLRAKHAPHIDDVVVTDEINGNTKPDITPIPPAEDKMSLTTDRGEIVTSQSKKIIADLLNQLGLDYKHQYPVEGKSGIKRPDFMVFDSTKKMLLWEHIDMPTSPENIAKWKQKLAWYAENGFIELENLFVTTDAPDGNLDSSEVMRVAEQLLARM